MPTSEPEAVELGFRLLELERSPRVLHRAVGIVTRGTQEKSKAFGEYLALVGEDRSEDVALRWLRCGRVCFDVEVCFVPAALEVVECNCAER